MITQIEIDGFKSFQKFKGELAPLPVIVGENGSGKSNLFDALQLLSSLLLLICWRRFRIYEVKGMTFL
jgi:AAA15 family ATPase/GTPase